MSEKLSTLSAVRTVAEELAELGKYPSREDIVEYLSSEVDDVTEPMIEAVEYLLRRAKLKVVLPYLPREMQKWED